MNQVKFNPQYGLYLRKLSKSKKGIVSIALVITIGQKRTKVTLTRETLPQVWDVVQQRVKNGKGFPKGKIRMFYPIPEKAMMNCDVTLFLIGHKHTENLAKTYLRQSVHFKIRTDESK